MRNGNIYPVCINGWFKFRLSLCDSGSFLDADNKKCVRVVGNMRRANTGKGLGALFNIYFSSVYLLYVCFSVLLQIAFFELETV